MNPEIFAEWLRRQGRQVRRTASSYWVDLGCRTYQAFPYHWLIRPGEAELNQLLQGQKAIGLRYSTFPDMTAGLLSYHAVREAGPYDLEALGKWARKNVRRGAKNCRVEPLPFSRLAKEGWRLQMDTLHRQGRQVKPSREAWSRLCLAAADLPGFGAWGAFVAGRLAASVLTFKMQDCGYLLYQQCLREYLAAHVNNALSFTVTRSLLGRPGIRSVFYGLHSLDAPVSVDEFKFRMGYAAKPVRQRVVFHPWLSPLFNGYSHAAVRRLLGWRPGSPLLAKAEGLMRFYLEGKRPLGDQDFPDVLKTCMPEAACGNAGPSNQEMVCKGI